MQHAGSRRFAHGHPHAWWVGRHVDGDPMACAIRFSDVQPADYYYLPVEYLACRAVIGGYAGGTYRHGTNLL